MLLPLCTMACASLLPLLSHADCKRAAFDIPVTIAGTRPVVSAKINNQDVRLVVDSGAFFSMISSAAAEELKLKMGPAPFGLYVRGIGGTTNPYVATAQVFTLANVDIPHVEFLVGGSQTTNGIGLLGQSFLVNWNVEYDLAKGMIRIFKDTGCSKQFLAYWAIKSHQPYTLTSIDNVTLRTPHAIGHAYINGQKIRVLFDTGAFASVLSLREAERAGVKVDSPDVVDGGFTWGVGRGLVKSYIAPFSSFKFADGEEIKNARLRIADIDIGIADMIIGGDFFLSHRIFIANNQDKVYITYNGGPVFDLRKIDAKTAALGATDASSDNSAGKPGDITAADEKPSEEAKPEDKGLEDAAALARRGTASAGRHDYAAASADLTRAIALEPNNPDYYYERGRVLWNNKEQPKAMADFDRAIELKPDFVLALMSRAQLRLNARSVPEARADLETIDKIVAKQADVRYEMGFAFERADLLAPAITQFDLWIASHGEDARRFYAIGGRCRSRAMLGQDLSVALKDCNDAVNHSDGKNHAAMLDNRALVRLRLGDYGKAISDYDASIKMEPNRAWPLFGRGLAKLKNNQQAAGAADIAEAIKIAPNVANGYNEIGLTP
jgi:tetratricopeptide (TPR) repeat protein/predicted aspartyl protease